MSAWLARFDGGDDSASDGIRHLVSGYAQRHWPEKLLVMLQAFIDDSGSEIGDRRFVLAGYIQSAANWISFSNDWDAALRASPRIEYWRTVEAQNLRGQFQGWSEPTRDAKLIRLAEIVGKYRLWSVQCSVSKADYDSILKPVAPYNLHNPYFVCFLGVMVPLARFHHEQGNTIPVDFVFDEHGGLGVEAVAWYYYVKQLQTPETQALLGATPTFADDKKVLPIQAADMLAWHVRRESERRTPPEKLPAIEYLRGSGRHLEAEITQDMLQSWASKFSKIRGVNQIQDRRSWRAMKPELLRRLSLGLGPPVLHENLLKRALKRLAAFISAKFFRGGNQPR